MSPRVDLSMMNDDNHNFCGFTTPLMLDVSVSTETNLPHQNTVVRSINYTRSYLVSFVIKVAVTST